MNCKTILLTGLPRSGTSLSCYLLNKVNNVLALNEPLVPKEFDGSAGHPAQAKKIQEFVIQTRTSVLEKGRAFSAHQDGVVPDNTMAENSGSNGLRQAIISRGEIDVSDRHLSSDFTLVIKHTAMFAALLPQINELFPVYAVIRNPLAVLASWNTIDVPINQGRIPAGEKFSPSLVRALDACPDRLARQITILEWFLGQFYEYLNEANIIRYESLIREPAHITKVLGIENSEDVGWNKLESRNNSYKLDILDAIYEELLLRGEYVWRFYSRERVMQLYKTMKAVK